MHGYLHEKPAVVAGRVNGKGLIGGAAVWVMWMVTAGRMGLDETYQIRYRESRSSWVWVWPIVGCF